MKDKTMTEKKMLDQLEDLIVDRQLFVTTNIDNPFQQDIKALKKIIHDYLYLKNLLYLNEYKIPKILKKYNYGVNNKNECDFLYELVYCDKQNCYYSCKDQDYASILTEDVNILVDDYADSVYYENGSICLNLEEFAANNIFLRTEEVLKSLTKKKSLNVFKEKYFIDENFEKKVNEYQKNFSKERKGELNEKTVR